MESIQKKIDDKDKQNVRFEEDSELVSEQEEDDDSDEDDSQESQDDDGEEVSNEDDDDEEESDWQSYMIYFYNLIKFVFSA